MEEVKKELAKYWLPNIYREEIRTLRTRSFAMEIPEHENLPEILHTLLGIELKVGKMRYACPDLATARYLSVFARIGCRAVAIPYDITKISALADNLETAWHRAFLVLQSTTNGKTPPVIKRSRSTLIRCFRNEIGEIGAGDLMPEFKQNTKQKLGGGI